ncbi:MAG: hypothetical protein EBQ85_07860 [Proteobacteria bacterium]|nr:hypothetical protein [Pseudomonadota bacterium]
MIKAKFLFVLGLIALNVLGAPISSEELEKELKGKGLSGWIHGASDPMGLFVFTYREPGNFFNHQEFPLVASHAGIEKTLKTLNRHDEVLIKGYFLENGAPIRHIFVEDLSLIKKYESPVPAPAPYPYKANLPQDLDNQEEILAKVHAIAENGKILVVEYKDAIVPVVVGNPTWVKDLYRNDQVKLKIQVRNYPSQPTHVSLDTKSTHPVTVVDRMVAWHGRKGSVEGNLVLFPKSPQVNFNVFAIQVVDSNGLVREFTLVNFEDDKVFEQIRIKLQSFWDNSPGGVENGRNKLINRSIKLKATGTFNVVDPGQANPQVLLEGPQAVDLVFAK